MTPYMKSISPDLINILYILDVIFGILAYIILFLVFCHFVVLSIYTLQCVINNNSELKNIDFKKSFIFYVIGAILISVFIIIGTLIPPKPDMYIIFSGESHDGR